MTLPRAAPNPCEAARVALAALSADADATRRVTTEAGFAQLTSLQEHAALLIETEQVSVELGSRDAIAMAARRTEIALRELSSETLLSRIAYERGFRVEDLLLVELQGPEEALPHLLQFWRRRLLPETTVSTHEGPLVRVRAAFVERGVIPTSQREAYASYPALAGRVRVEAFELHVTEHCNLRCEHCCNSSPYLPPKTLRPEDVAQTLATVSRVLYADVFKIMGGEPLLHPQITEVLRAVKASGVSPVVRLFSNGLLLSKMKDDFWRELDQLTVSSYASAPVRPEQLAQIEQKAREFDVILNVKPVDHFSEVMYGARRENAAEVEATFRSCWLRHRCLVARGGRFYICTRAAYLEDTHAYVALSQPFSKPGQRRVEDSVALDDPELQAKMLALLNRDSALHSCQFCLGGDGPRVPHAQLTRADVRAGRLRRLQVLS